MIFQLRFFFWDNNNKNSRKWWMMAVLAWIICSCSSSIAATAEGPIGKKGTTTAATASTPGSNSHYHHHLLLQDHHHHVLSHNLLRHDDQRKQQFMERHSTVKEYETVTTHMDPSRRLSEAAGQGQACEIDSDCQNQADSQGLLLWCHPEFSVCVECRSDQDCTGLQKQSICELENGVCVEQEEESAPYSSSCKKDWDCTNGYFCNTTLYGQCEQIVCTSDRGCGHWRCDTITQKCLPIQCPATTRACPNGLLCYTATEVCVSCLSDDDCEFGLDCSPTRHECVPASLSEPWRCRSDYDCPMSTCWPGGPCQYYSCDPESGQCLQQRHCDDCQQRLFCNSTTRSCDVLLPCNSDKDCESRSPYSDIGLLVCDPEFGLCTRPPCSSTGSDQENGITPTIPCHDGQMCNPEGGMCVACLSNEHCKFGFACNTFYGDCVADKDFSCRSEEDCPLQPCQHPHPDFCPIFTCDVEKRRCVDVFGTNCTTDDNCRGLFCDSSKNNNDNNGNGGTTTGTCAYCTNDEHCLREFYEGEFELQEICLNGQCGYPPCKYHSDCENEKGLICDSRFFSCYYDSCLSDESCPMGLLCNLTASLPIKEGAAAPCPPEDDCWNTTANSTTTTTTNNGGDRGDRGLCAPIPCTSDTDCSSIWWVCDTEHGQCAQPKCSSTGACDDDRLLCNKESGLCAFCISSDNCDRGFWCDTFLGECVFDDIYDGCRSDADCPRWICADPDGGGTFPPGTCGPGITYVCDMESGQCIGNGDYGSKCYSSSECGGLRCDTMLHMCVNCTTDDHCSGGEICAKKKVC